MDLIKKFENYNIELRKKRFKEKLKKKRKIILKEKKIFDETGKSANTWKNTFLLIEKKLENKYNQFLHLQDYKEKNYENNSGQNFPKISNNNFQKNFKNSENKNFNQNSQNFQNRENFQNFENKIIEENSQNSENSDNNLDENYQNSLIHLNLKKKLDQNITNILYEIQETLQDLRYNISEKQNLETNPIYLIFENKIIHIIFKILENPKIVYNSEILNEIFFILSNLTSSSKKYQKILFEKDIINFYIKNLKNPNIKIFKHILWGITNLIIDNHEILFDFEEENLWNLIILNIKRFNFDFSVIDIFIWFLNSIFNPEIFLKEFIYDQLLLTFDFIIKFINDEIIMIGFVEILESFFINKILRRNRVKKLYELNLIPVFSDILKIHNFQKNFLITKKIILIIGIISHESEKIINEIKIENLDKIFLEIFKNKEKIKKNEKTGKIEKTEKTDLKPFLLTYNNLITTNSKIFLSLFTEEILNQIILILLTNEKSSICVECINILISILIFYKNDKNNLYFIIIEKNLLQIIFSCKEKNNEIVKAILKLLEQILVFDEFFGIFEDLKSFCFEDLFEEWRGRKDQKVFKKVMTICDRFDLF